MARNIFNELHIHPAIRETVANHHVDIIDRPTRPSPSVRSRTDRQGDWNDTAFTAASAHSAFGFSRAGGRRLSVDGVNDEQGIACRPESE